MKSPGYLPLVLELMSRLQPRPGAVVFVDVHHDVSCGYFTAGVCDCSPAVTLRNPSAPPARVAAGGAR